ncbi:hypothetical protein [Macrococcoides caseolyticum]|uniref:hypothetical protein n=1 Tax=Macrococcoides caseolyticum TaxID=69966 RepID=UPI00105D2986|nr:hypothetical protein [Macrococcus caseolyticus]TDM18901.1 hypothetical protein ETI00_02770 [Macrococcus caseolyticus]
MLKDIIISALNESNSVKIVTSVEKIEYKIKHFLSESENLLSFETSTHTVHLLKSQIVSIEISEPGGRVTSFR